MLKIQEETLELNKERHTTEGRMLGAMTSFFEAGAKYYQAKTVDQIARNVVHISGEEINDLLTREARNVVDESGEGFY